MKRCYFLKPPHAQWERGFALLQVFSYHSLLYFCITQERELASTAIIEAGRAMWVMGGLDADSTWQITTQVVRDRQQTIWGPNLTEATYGHCSVTLEDGSVLTTGGRRESTPSGSPKTEIYNFTSKLWSRKADLRMRRYNHSCTPVWLNTEDPDVNGIVQTGSVTNNSILSVVVAGGKFLLWKSLKPILQESSLKREKFTLQLEWSSMSLGMTPGFTFLTSQRLTRSLS